MSKLRKASFIGFALTAGLLLAGVLSGAHGCFVFAELSFFLSCVLGIACPEHKNARPRHDSIDPLATVSSYHRHDDVDLLHLGKASDCADPFCPAHCCDSSNRIM